MRVSLRTSPYDPAGLSEQQRAAVTIMGSCLSKTKFQGEGRTLNEASSAAWSAATTQGQRLGSAGGPTTQPMPSPSVLGSSTPATDREARAQAAERRINAQAAKGTPTHGKLSQQLMHNKSAHPLTQNQDEPHRVIVSLQTPHYTPLKSLLRQPQPCPPTHLSSPPLTTVGLNHDLASRLLPKRQQHTRTIPRPITATALITNLYIQSHVYVKKQDKVNERCCMEIKNAAVM